MNEAREIEDQLNRVSKKLVRDMSNPPFQTYCSETSKTFLNSLLLRIGIWNNKFGNSIITKLLSQLSTIAKLRQSEVHKLNTLILSLSESIHIRSQEIFYYYGNNYPDFQDVHQIQTPSTNPYIVEL